MKQLFAYEEEAGRIELIIRILYSILIGIVLYLYGIVAGICMIIQFFVILIMGRRSHTLSEFIRGYLEYYVHILPYTAFMTDERPGILPRTVGIFEEEA
jgi:hypothetical protein